MITPRTNPQRIPFRLLRANDTNEGPKANASSTIYHWEWKLKDEKAVTLEDTYKKREYFNVW